MIVSVNMIHPLFVEILLKRKEKEKKRQTQLRKGSYLFTDDNKMLILTAATLVPQYKRSRTVQKGEKHINRYGIPWY